MNRDLLSWLTRSARLWGMDARALLEWRACQDMQVSFSAQTIGWTATMASNTPTLPPLSKVIGIVHGAHSIQPSTAVEYIPRGTTARATRRFRRLSAVPRLRMAPQILQHALRASISKPRLKPRGTSARPAHRPSHRRFLTVLPAPRGPPLPSPARDPQTVGDTYARFEPSQRRFPCAVCCM